jgi:hypothetical protein
VTISEVSVASKKTPDHFLTGRVVDEFLKSDSRIEQHSHWTQQEPPETVVMDGSIRSSSFVSEDRFRSTHVASSDHPDGIVN